MGFGGLWIILDFDRFQRKNFFEGVSLSELSSSSLCSNHLRINISLMLINDKPFRAKL
jgi:hypothetical protein